MARMFGLLVVVATVIPGLPAVAQRGTRYSLPPDIPHTPISSPPERLTGRLIRIDAEGLILQPQDRRVILMQLASRRYYSARNDQGRSRQALAVEFEVGDEVTVEAAIKNGRYEASSIELDHKGEEEDKAAADAIYDTAITGFSKPIFAKPSGDPVIDNALRATVSFMRTLPDFIVRQNTTRFTGRSASLDSAWHKFDQISANLITENNKETFQNVLVNGRKPRQPPEKSGSWSTGEFSSILIEVLAPHSHAAFTNKRRESIVKRQAWHYDFSVEEENSHWILNTGGQIYLPAFAGGIWIDEETSRVLRVEISTRDIPPTFPTQLASSVVEYDFVPLGEAQFLLPSRAESINCLKGGKTCSRNSIDFKNYRKFGTESSISFDKEPR